MDHLTRQKIFLEATWWAITAFVVFLILFPILKNTPYYPFQWSNIIFIVAFITLARYIFLFKYTFLQKYQYFKIILIFLCIPLIFNLVNNLNYFIAVTDESAYYFLDGNLSQSQRNKMGLFIRTEMLFFGVGSVLATIIFPFKLLRSIWRYRNKGIG
ncbi:MAG: hypothetical protein HKN87_19295 [Saprospiraceae bacterium]|nr:hypothetical protein [Saprospiraceae bacterium]